MPSAWRIVKRKYAAQAFDGEGARLYGGRWNSPGTRMVYASGTVALAALEMLVHLNRSSLLAFYVLCEVRFDDSLVSAIEADKIPGNWRQYPPPSWLQSFGDAWIRRGLSVVLGVPSAVVERERNYLLNPRHPDFGQVTIGQPAPFRFDSRLLAP